MGVFLTNFGARWVCIYRQSLFIGSLITTHGKCMAFVWLIQLLRWLNTLCQSMSSFDVATLVTTHGTCMAHARHLYGTCIGAVWRIQSLYSPIICKICNALPRYVRVAPRSCVLGLIYIYHPWGAAVTQIDDNKHAATQIITVSRISNYCQCSRIYTLIRTPKWASIKEAVYSLFGILFESQSNDIY